MRPIPRAMLILILLTTLSSTLAVTGCQHATPTPLPVVRTLTHIAAAALTPSSSADPTTQPATKDPPSMPLPTATPTLTPIPTLTPTPTPTPTPTITPTTTPTPAANSPTATETAPSILNNAEGHGTSTVEPPTPFPVGVYWPTQASYHIEVDLDYWGHAFRAQEWLVFTNTLGLALDDLLLNVPVNGTDATFGLSSLTVNGEPAIYALEDTSLRVELPDMLPPGQSVVLEGIFEVSAPYMRVDSIFGGGSVGYSENAFNAGNWYPVLAPYHADEGWLAIPWHPVGDPYVTDVGACVVEVRTSPDVTVVGPGALEGWPDEGRWRFTVPLARTFAFAASHRYESAVETAYGVTIASYYYPEHQLTGQLALANAAAAVKLFSDLFGPYPYPDLRIAETDFSGGQEFSGFMLFGSGTHQDYLDAGSGQRTILFALIPHETAHQWWYSVVGNDQAREPWLDEALAKYSEQLFYERLYPEHAEWRWASMGNLERQPESLEVTIYDYVSKPAYKSRVYLNGALFVAQLRQALGDDAFFDLIQAHYRQGSNRIVTAAEFLSLLPQHGDQAVIQPIVDRFFNP